MKHIILGAGATYSQAKELGNTHDQSPPLIRDFAKKMWSNYTPHPYLEHYLENKGYSDLGSDPRELFYKLEVEGTVNIEQFLEYIWINKHLNLPIQEGSLPPGYISGLRITTGGSDEQEPFTPQHGEFWDNMLYHGIGNPLVGIMIDCFFENGKGWKYFSQTQKLIELISLKDVVINLNYDTVFELALQQSGTPFCYSPNIPDAQLLVVKPHGSLNLVINETGFAFGQPEWLGTPQPPGYRSYSGIIPPRLNKTYKEHPVSQMIIAPVIQNTPEKIVMWGVGLTESDTDLIALYSRWIKSGATIDVINPDEEAARRISIIMDTGISHYMVLEDWLQMNKDK